MGRKKKIIEHIHELGRYSVKEDGNVLTVRKRRGVEGNLVKKDAAFAGSRLENAGFKTCAHAAKQLKKLVDPLLSGVKDAGLNSRLLQLMLNIRAQDDLPQGYKQLANGIEKASGTALLKDFNFLSGKKLHELFFIQPKLLAGGIELANVVSGKHFLVPDGASHVVIEDAICCLNLRENKAEAGFSKPFKLPLNLRKRQIVLQPDNLPTTQGVRFYILKITFLKKTYTLKKDGWMAMAILPG